MSPGPGGAWGSRPSPRPARAEADRGGVALAQYSRVELQLVELGPQGLPVAPHDLELLC